MIWGYYNTRFESRCPAPSENDNDITIISYLGGHLIRVGIYNNIIIVCHVHNHTLLDVCVCVYTTDQTATDIMIWKGTSVPCPAVAVETLACPSTLSDAFSLSLSVCLSVSYAPNQRAVIALPFPFLLVIAASPSSPDFYAVHLNRVGVGNNYYNKLYSARTRI